jgi:hypothetical protein
MSGRSAWKGLENGQKRKTSGQTSGHARKFRQSPEEPWCVLAGLLPGLLCFPGTMPFKPQQVVILALGVSTTVLGLATD